MAFSKFLDPKLDLTFKKIFGTEKNKKILIHFLNDILGCTEVNTIQEIEFISTILNPEIASERQSIVDVLCQDSVGNRFVVEMQLTRDKGFEKRAQYYAAKAYSRQVGKYANLQKIFFIAISNCVLFPDKSNYISSHTIRDEKTNEHDLQDFQFVFIELPKFPKNKVEQLTSIVERWCYFFKHAEETTEKDLKKIAREAPIIKRAYDELDRFNWNEKDLTAYEERIMDLYKEEAILEYKLETAQEKGIKKGREEGIQIGEEKGRQEGIQIGQEYGIKIGAKKGKIEVAKNLLKAGASVDLIAESTGLPKAEIAQLKKEVTFKPLS